MIPNRIFVTSHGFPNVIGGPQRSKDTDVEFIRADKVKEILDNEIAELEVKIKEAEENCQILTLDDVSTRQCALIGIKEKIEAL